VHIVVMTGARTGKRKSFAGWLFNPFSFRSRGATYPNRAPLTRDSSKDAATRGSSTFPASEHALGDAERSRSKFEASERPVPDMSAAAKRLLEEGTATVTVEGQELRARLARPAPAGQHATVHIECRRLDGSGFSSGRSKVRKENLNQAFLARLLARHLATSPREP
jgi:hypothetical protein